MRTHHRHRVSLRVVQGFTAPAVPPDHPRYHPAAHGGVEEVETCACGATRRTNINGWRRERGFWTAPAPRAGHAR